MIWVALIGPFNARLFVAWMVSLRVRGLPPAASNLPPKRKSSDYPAPNDPVAAALVLLGSAVVAGLAARLVGETAANLVPTWVFTASAATSCGISIAYALRRVRRDGRLTQERLRERLLDSASSARLRR